MKASPIAERCDLLGGAGVERPPRQRHRPGEPHDRRQVLAAAAPAPFLATADPERLETRAGARPTVTGAARAPHIASLAFPGIPAEPLLHALDRRGVLASAGSACASRTAGPSPTLKAIGVDDRTGVLRFSLSRHTTAADVDGALAALADAVRELAGVQIR